MAWLGCDKACERRRAIDGLPPYNSDVTDSLNEQLTPTEGEEAGGQESSDTTGSGPTLQPPAVCSDSSEACRLETEEMMKQWADPTTELGKERSSVQAGLNDYYAKLSDCVSSSCGEAKAAIDAGKIKFVYEYRSSKQRYQNGGPLDAATYTKGSIPSLSADAAIVVVYEQGYKTMSMGRAVLGSSGIPYSTSYNLFGQLFAHEVGHYLDYLANGQGIYDQKNSLFKGREIRADLHRQLIFP